MLPFVAPAGSSDGCIRICRSSSRELRPLSTLQLTLTPRMTTSPKSAALADIKSMTAIPVSTSLITISLPAACPFKCTPEILSGVIQPTLNDSISASMPYCETASATIDLPIGEWLRKLGALRMTNATIARASSRKTRRRRERPSRRRRV